MTTLDIFTYAGREVRTVLLAGEPWFVAADVCAVLGLTNPSMSVNAIDEADLSATEVSSSGQRRAMRTVNESGLYELVFQSRKPEAKIFRRWVTSEVLPAIRRTGTYTAATAPSALPDRKALAQMVIEAETARELAEAKVAEMAPKVEVAERLLDADGDLSVGDAAKALTRAGVKVGESRLFAALNNKGWIYRAQGDGRWRVYQAAIESGHMSVLPTSHYHPKTGVLVLDPPQPRVTPKGLQRLLADHGALVPVGAS